MKPFHTLAFLLTLYLLPGQLCAQKDKQPPVFESYHKNIFAELLGSNILAGVNFDMRLKKGRMDGIGFRAGVGGVSTTVFDENNEFRVGVATFPIEFNHVVGKRRSGLVSGIGLLPIYATLNGTGTIVNNEVVWGEGFGLAGGFLTFGYRLQPVRTGFMMQFIWNPMLLRGSGFSQGWIGLGLGIGFK